MGSNLDELSAEDKLVKIMLELRNIRPFYSSLYEVIEKVEDNDTIDTMAVTLTQLLYNKHFVEITPLDKLMFVVLHEICHIALMHVARAKGKDLDKWNTACDLYVNKLLCEEFKINPYRNSTDITTKITVPTDCLYDSQVDVDNDTAESIYNSLIESQNTTDSEQQNESKSKSKPESNDNTSNSTKNINSENNKSKQQKKYTYKNNTITASTSNQDIIEPHGDAAEMDNISKDKINEALVRHSMKDTGAGDTSSDKIINIIQELTRSKVKWKQLLRKYCIRATETEYTFNNPDKRLIYTGGIYPGATKSISNKDLGRIKICMDTSGSISDSDINEFYGQVRQLLKEYKLDAEVIYWDCEVKSKCNMSKISELTNIDVKGGGGTNPRCLFEYFDSKQCKVKPDLVLIFTDGYFWSDTIENKWIRKYKNTIWVMSEYYNKEFKPDFGKVTQAEFNN